MSQYNWDYETWEDFTSFWTKIWAHFAPQSLKAFTLLVFKFGNYIFGWVNPSPSPFRMRAQCLGVCAVARKIPLPLTRFIFWMKYPLSCCLFLSPQLSLLLYAVWYEFKAVLKSESYIWVVDFFFLFFFKPWLFCSYKFYLCRLSRIEKYSDAKKKNQALKYAFRRREKKRCIREILLNFA